jgi:hypothetical protein
VKDVVCVEKVQKAFTRRVLRNCGLPELTYDERLRFFRIDSLEFRRLKTDLVFLYKMSRNAVDLQLSCLYPPSDSVRGDTRTNGSKLLHPCVPRHDIVNNSFAFRVRRVWNNLPEKCVSAATVKEFRSRIDLFLSVNSCK